MAVAKGGQPTAGMRMAQAVRWVFRVVLPIFGLGPSYGFVRVRLDEQNSSAGPIRDVLEPDFFCGASKDAVLADGCQINGFARAGLHARISVHLWHLRNKAAVVLAIPRFIEMELLIETLLIQIWQH